MNGADAFCVSPEKRTAEKTSRGRIKAAGGFVVQKNANILN
jgi:hypothetical protein